MKDTDMPDRIGPKVKAISNLFRRTANGSTMELGITAAQSFILSFLYRHGDFYPCQHDIEIKFNIKHPTATGILKRLAENGFVEFKSDKADKRLKRIAITERGKMAAKQTKSRLDEMEARLTNDFSEDELNELHRLLDKLVDRARIQEGSSHEGEDKKC